MPCRLFAHELAFKAEFRTFHTSAPWNWFVPDRVAHLNLRRTAPFHVHGGDDHAHFLDHVGIDRGGRLETLDAARCSWSCRPLEIHIARPPA